MVGVVLEEGGLWLVMAVEWWLGLYVGGLGNRCVGPAVGCGWGSCARRCLGTSVARCAADGGGKCWRSVRLFWQGDGGVVVCWWLMWDWVMQ